MTNKIYGFSIIALFDNIYPFVHFTLSWSQSDAGFLSGRISGKAL